jgi:hypothetical protein
VNNELERIWKEASWPNYDTVAEFARKDRKYIQNLSQDSWCPIRDLNRASFKYKPGALPLQQHMRTGIDIHSLQNMYFLIYETPKCRRLLDYFISVDITVQITYCTGFMISFHFMHMVLFEEFCILGYNTM